MAIRLRGQVRAVVRLGLSGVQQAPIALHAHVNEPGGRTRVLMEDYTKKGKLVGSAGDVYPGDPALSKKARNVINNNLGQLAADTGSVFNTGTC